MYNGGMYDIALMVIYFAFYALFGYVGEVIFVRVTEGKWVDRSLLDGPFFLLYGVGALLPITIFTNHSPVWQVVVVSAVYSGVVEYVGSILYEKIGLKLWDYDGKIGNIRGRVCLASIFTFIVTALVIIYFIQPWLSGVVTRLQSPAVIVMAAAFILYVTINGHKKLRGQIMHYRKTGKVSNQYYDRKTAK